MGLPECRLFLLFKNIIIVRSDRMKMIESRYVHEIQLKSIRLLSLDSFIDNEFSDAESGDVQVDVSIGNYSEVKSLQEGKAFLKTRVSGTQGDQEIFSVEAIYEGVCFSQIELGEEEFKFFLEMQSIPMLWSYARDTVHSVTLKMGIEPILLPVLNIT